MSFSDYLDNIIKEREKSGNTPSFGKQRFANANTESTNQSTARDAIAKQQEQASVQATQETKARHIRVNGRCVLESELVTNQQLQPSAPPANPDRVAYIQELKKSLRVKRHTQ